MKIIPENLHKEFLRDMTAITQIVFQKWECLWIAAKKIDNAPRDTQILSREELDDLEELEVLEELGFRAF